MNIAVVAGLGLIGSYIANNNKETNDPVSHDDSNDSAHKQTTDPIKKKVQFIESNEDRTDIEFGSEYRDSNSIRLFPSDTNNKVHHIYDNQMVPKLKDKYYGMAKDQREKSKIPSRTNIIPPFFNQPYQNNLMSASDKLTMGPVPNSELLGSNNVETFESQFNLQSVDNMGEPASMGDTWNSTNKANILNLERNLATSQGFSPFDSNNQTDMTYGIVQSEHFVHNNMQPFTSKRDLGTSESNNFEYKMEIFSGSSKNWNPKREVLPFFDPEEYKQTPFKTEHYAEEERNRIVQSRSKQNERPFEPVKVAPGLNLDYDEQPVSGRHDTFRVMPKDTNDLRPQNKPKLTYAGRVNTTVKKGEKRPVVAPVIKRRPEQWRYQTVDDLVPSKAIVTGPTPQGNYIIPDNARQATTCELKGPAQATTQVGPDDRAGKVKITKRVKHVEDKLGPKGTDQFNPNAKSFNIPINERNTTNFDDHMPAKNTNQGGIKFDPNDLAKTTQRQNIEKFNPVGPNGTTQPPKYDPNHLANPTNRQSQTTKQFNTNAGPNQKRTTAFDPNHLANPTNRQTQTTKQFNTNAGPNQKRTTAIDFNDLANTTKRQTQTTKQFNTNAGPNQKRTTAFDPNDLANPTQRQTQTTKQFNTNAGPSQKQNIAFDPADLANPTLRQTLTESQFNTHAGPNQRETTAFDPTHLANPTLRQTMTTKQFNTMVGALVGSYSNLSDQAKMTLKQLLATQSYEQIMNAAQHNAYANFSDEAKTTLKQILSLCNFNTNMKSAQGNTYANPTDVANTTLRQILSAFEFNTNMGANQKETVAYDPTNIAKTTMKQTLTTKQFNNMMGQLISSYTNLSDQAKTTLKQTLTNLEFNTNMGSAQGNPYANLSDEAKTTLKQLLSMEQFNTNMGSAQGNSYANTTDLAKTTLREILSALEFNTNMGASQSNPYANLSDTAKTTLKQIMSTLEFNTNAKPSQSNPSAYYTDMAKTTVKELLSTMELNTNMGSAQSNPYANFTDEAKTTIRQTLTEAEFNTFLKQAIGSYSNMTDEAKTTIKQLLATQPLETIIGLTSKGSYANISDQAKTTLKQLLTLQTFSNHIKQNIGSYANLSDEAKTTVKQLLATVEYNNNIKSANQGTYANLTDLAKTTIKEFIAINSLNNHAKPAGGANTTPFTQDAKATQKQELDIMQYNNNVGSAQKQNIATDPNDLAKMTHRQDIDAQQFDTNRANTSSHVPAIDYNDLAKMTHKQDLLNENYLGTMINSSVGTQQVNFDMPMTMKDLNKVIDYNSAAYAAGFSKNPQNQNAERHMRQNITKEVVAQGRYPTLSGQKQAPTTDVYNSMRQKEMPNFNRPNAPTLTTKINLEDRAIFNAQNLKEKATYDERLFNELLAQLDDNPLANNVYTTAYNK